MRRHSTRRSTSRLQNSNLNSNNAINEKKKKKRRRIPTLGDTIDVAWDDRDEIFTGVIFRQAVRKSRRRQPELFEFEILYHDGDAAIHDLDTMRWRFTDTKYWYHPGDLADIKPRHVKHHLQFNASHNIDNVNSLNTATEANTEMKTETEMKNKQRIENKDKVDKKEGHQEEENDDDDDIEIRRKSLQSPKKRRRYALHENNNSEPPNYENLRPQIENDQKEEKLPRLDSIIRIPPTTTPLTATSTIAYTNTTATTTTTTSNSSSLHLSNPAEETDKAIPQVLNLESLTPQHFNLQLMMKEQTNNTKKIPNNITLISPRSIAQFEAVTISSPKLASASAYGHNVFGSTLTSSTASPSPFASTSVSECIEPSGNDNTKQVENTNTKQQEQQGQEQGQQKWTEVWDSLRDSRIPVRKRLSLSNLIGFT